MYQPLMLVGHESVPLFHVRHDESILSVTLEYVKVSFGQLNRFLIILFLFVI